MRLSWYGDTGVAVFSIWQGGRCTGTFRLPVDELPRMMATLRGGPDGSDASHDVSGAHDATRVRDFGAETVARDLPPRDLPPRDLPPRDLPPRDLAPRDLPPRDLPPRDLPPRDLPPRDLPPRDLPPRDLPRDLAPRDLDRDEADRPVRERPRRALEDAATSYLSDSAAPDGYPGERTAAFPAPGAAPRSARHADPDLPPAGRGRASDPGYDIPSPARMPADENLAADPLGMGYRGAETAPYRDGGRGSRGSYGPADDSRTDPGAGDPLGYRPGESRGYGAAEVPDYPAGDPLGYRPGDDRDYAAPEGRDYRGGGGRHYAAAEGPGYGAEEGRGYPGEDDRGYAADDPRGYAPGDDLGYRAGEGRRYGSGEGAGYRGGEGRHYAAGGEPAPEGYHSWSEPESAGQAYAPAWTDGYADGPEYAPDSGEDPYGHAPRGGRRDRRLAAGSHGPTGIGGPRADDARHARLG